MLLQSGLGTHVTRHTSCVTRHCLLSLLLQGARYGFMILSAEVTQVSQKKIHCAHLWRCRLFFPGCFCHTFNSLYLQIVNKDEGGGGARGFGGGGFGGGGRF